MNVDALCAASARGDIDAVRKIISMRPDLVNVPRQGDFGEKMALHFAVLNRDLEMTRALMSLGADARKGFWPYREATASLIIAKDRGYDEIVAAIEQEEERRRRDQSRPGASISSKTDEIQQAILAGTWDAAMRLMEADLSLVAACDVRGATPLHVAAWIHNPAQIAWLLDRGADANARDMQGKTPLDTPRLWQAGRRMMGLAAFWEMRVPIRRCFLIPCEACEHRAPS